MTQTLQLWTMVHALAPEMTLIERPEVARPTPRKLVYIPRYWSNAYHDVMWDRNARDLLPRNRGVS